MKKFTFVFSLLLMLVTTAMAQKAHQRVSHDGWVVTAPNEAGVNKNEGGVAFIADDDAMTFYHSNWSSNYADGNGVNKGKDGLQAFMVELPTSVSDISLISYTGRSDNNTSGWAKGVRIYVYETLPAGWPADGLSSLTYTQKEELLKSDNANLGEPAFDNTASPWDVSGRNKQFAFFSEYKTGKYVLFVMDSGHDKWLTCSDFQIYQSKDYSVKEKSAYMLKVTNAASEGDWYIDTKTANADNQGLSTVAISQTAVETYFAWGENGWKISTNENVDGNYVGVTKWCAPPLHGTATEWQMLINNNEEIVLFQSVYYGDNRISRCFLGGDVTTNKSVVKLYTDNYSEKAVTLSLIDASAKPVEVTYRVLFNDEVKTTQTVSTYIGANYPDVTVELPFGVSVVNKPEGEILLSDATEVDGVYTITKDLDVAVSLPFKYADSEANIKNWYYIQMHSNSTYTKYLQYNAGNYIEWADATRTAGEEDSYSWAFVGNPFDGLKLVNRAAPADANAVTSAKDSGNPGFGPIDGATAWNVKASRVNNDNEHFCFQYPNSANYMNAQGGKVAFWDDNDQGSTMWVTERDLTMTTELQALIDQVDAAIAAYGEGGNTVGYYTAESVNNLLAVLAAAKTAVADPDRTLDTNRAAMTNLENAVAALKTIQPEENVLYTIQNVSSSVYMNVTKNGGTVKSGDATAYELFKFVAAGDGKYYLYNVTRNKYLSSALAHGAGQVLFAAESTTDAKAVTIANLGKANQVSIVPDGGVTIHHDANYGTIVAWNAGVDSRSAWVIAATGLSTAKMTVLTELGIFCSEKDYLLEGEGYGYYSGNDEALLAALAPELYSKTVTELAEMTDDDVAAAGTAAADAVTEAANTFSLNVPAANSYVRIAYDFGGETGKLYVQGEASGVSGKANSPKMTDAADAASILYYGDDKLLSYTAGLYLKEDGNTRGLQAMNVTAGAASFEAGSVVGTLAVKVPAYMHANTSGDVRFIDHCSGTGNPVHTAHDMIVEAVTELPVTVTAAGYASFYTPVALEIPAEGVEVFYATQVNGDYVSLVKIESGKIPANTGVIIKADANTYNFAITNEEVAAIEGNIFKGTVNKQTITKENGSYYVLGIVDGKVGMYNAVNGADATTFINAGHKAYMYLEGAANSAGYRFDFDGTTGITEVETENANDAVIYDLTGRRVQDMNRAGIYIVNGKKVLVK